MRDSKIFDEAITQFFEPIASTAGLPLSRVQDGVYEIASPHFVMRIRLDTGHRRGLNVILRRASTEGFDEQHPGYGIAHFVRFGGAEWESEPFLQTDEDFMQRAHAVAKASEEYVIPYLLGRGEGEHFDSIEQQVAILGKARTRPT